MKVDHPHPENFCSKSEITSKNKDITTFRRDEGGDVLGWHDNRVVPDETHPSTLYFPYRPGPDPKDVQPSHPPQSVNENSILKPRVLSTDLLKRKTRPNGDPPPFPKPNTIVPSPYSFGYHPHPRPSRGPEGTRKTQL